MSLVEVVVFAVLMSTMSLAFLMGRVFEATRRAEPRREGNDGTRAGNETDVEHDEEPLIVWSTRSGELFHRSSECRHLRLAKHVRHLRRCSDCRPARDY